ncbi:hypothetical protein Vadar_010838 [Vaccinium darrowii]|uniref:Uncharacterized protein n=1 Tax=Vaccinium darrowii TaxID=229202 RepID=A0ACB7ZJI6_9ERIC|nr:hypothetical protein Vadar_010838 [Vaccinium darrowii]
MVCSSPEVEVEREARGAAGGGGNRWWWVSRWRAVVGLPFSVQNGFRAVVWPVYQMTISANAKQHCHVRSIEERVVKVTSFILSSQDDTLPFLIITRSSCLSMWEAKFSQRKSDMNIVVYKGNKDIRAIIRSLEFYNEDGCLMFQVLLSTPETVLEDSRILDGIKWVMLIVDECQSWTISGHLSRIKELNAHVKLLLVNSRVKQSAARNRTTSLESSSSPRWRGNFGGGRELEGPAPAMAPHLRNLRPSLTAVGLPHIPSHLLTKLPIIRAPSNSSVPSCGLGQATELVKSQRQNNGINQPDNITGLPDLKQLKGITATYRMTNKPLPVRHSPYVSGVLHPLKTFLDGERATAYLTRDIRDELVQGAALEITVRYYELAPASLVWLAQRHNFLDFYSSGK